MNPDEHRISPRAIQDYQNIEARLQAELDKVRQLNQVLENDIGNLNIECQQLIEQHERDQEEIAALVNQTDYWRKRTHKWMEEAKRVV